MPPDVLGQRLDRDVDPGAKASISRRPPTCCRSLPFGRHPHGAAAGESRRTSGPPSCSNRQVLARRQLRVRSDEPFDVASGHRRVVRNPDAEALEDHVGEVPVGPIDAFRQQDVVSAPRTPRSTSANANWPRARRTCGSRARARTPGPQARARSASRNARTCTGGRPGPRCRARTRHRRRPSWRPGRPA